MLFHAYSSSPGWLHWCFEESLVRTTAFRSTVGTFDRLSKNQEDRRTLINKNIHWISLFEGLQAERGEVSGRASQRDAKRR